MFDIYDLFQSIDIIVDDRLQNLNLDRTLICTITHDSMKAYGQYEVTYNATRFTASSEKTDYKTGDIVYVGVPQDNYSDAYIITKKLNDAEVNNAADPFQDFVQMVEYKDTEAYDVLKASYFTLQEPMLLFSKEIKDIEPYANLGISFLVSSLLPESCNYGFIVNVITAEPLNDAGDTYPQRHIFTFPSSEMLGKPTFYQGEFRQKKLVDISSLRNISSISVYLDVDSPVELNSDNNYLIFKDLNISFGYLTSNYSEDSVYVYTNGMASYKYEKGNPPPKNNLYIRWLYKNGLGKLLAVTEKNPQDKPENAKIKWYRLEGTEWKDLNNDDQLFYANFQADKYRSEEKIKCTIEYEVFGKELPLLMESNVLVLKNNTEGLSDIIETKTFEISTDLKDFSGFYNMDGSIADISMADEGRAVTAKFVLAEQAWSDMESEVALRVKWLFPAKSSMIICDSDQPSADGKNIVI